MVLASALVLSALSACGGSAGDSTADTGGSAEGDSPKITWRAQSVETSGTERQNCVEHFAQLVSDATDGNFTIEVFSAGTLYGQEDLIEAVPPLTTSPEVNPGSSWQHSEAPTFGTTRSWTRHFLLCTSRLSRRRTTPWGWSM